MNSYEEDLKYERKMDRISEQIGNYSANFMFIRPST